MNINKPVRFMLGALAVLALLAAACGDDGSGDTADTTDTAMDTGTAGVDAAQESAESTEPTDDGSSDTDADAAAGAQSDLEPIKIGFDSQEEELFSIVEARRAAEATVAYINAELGGVNGHPLELVVCTSGDGPEGAVACAQQFVNDDDITVMLTSSFSSNEASEVTVPAGLPMLALANLADDWQRDTEWVMDPGFLGILQAPVDYAADALGVGSMAIICADDPFYLEACEAAAGFAQAAGIEVFDVTPAGFEQADFTGIVTASEAAAADSILAAIDGTQCAPLADSLAALSVEATVLTVDTCALEESVAGGALDGWLVFGSSALPVDPSVASDDVLEGQRIIADYGSSEAEVYGLAGWAVANVLATHDALVRVGFDNLSRENVNAALGETQLELGWYSAISCPGPDPFPGACVSTVLALKVVGETMEFEAVAPIDYTQFESLG